MSSIPLFRYLERFFVLVAVFLIPMLTFCHAAGQADAPRESAPSSFDAAKASELDRGSSSQWRAYIWQTLPAENFNGPDPDPISETYQENDWKPFFIDSRFRLNNAGISLITRLRTLESDAIDPVAFKLDALTKSLERLNQLQAALSLADPEINDRRAESFFDAQPPASDADESAKPEAAGPSHEAIAEKYRETFEAASETDTRLTTAFFHFVREMNPYLQNQEVSKALLSNAPISKFLEGLEPERFNYKALRRDYEKYNKLAAQVTQRRVNVSSTARRGDAGNDIRDLQERLQQENFYHGRITGVYDADTARAVKEFQIAHLLDPDGAVGKATKEWLNVSFQEKAALLAYAMKAERQSPSRTNSRFIRINIPQFELQYYKDGQLQETHRIVVGKEAGKKVKFRGRMVGENQTPTLSSTIQQIILNPRWYVSDRIRLELQSQAGSDPEWFKKHGYVSMTSPSGAHRLFQSPGPKNALGRVKFEFPNPYAVYLHDTPLKHLFARSRRDFSHGCIRVDQAVELAQTILKDDASSTASKMTSILEGSRQVFVSLSKPVPISLEYIPVVVGSSGQIIFAGDLYGILKEEQPPEKARTRFPNDSFLL
jgi:murein L,D-transpeptidase YcbB/YkuD